MLSRQSSRGLYRSFVRNNRNLFFVVQQQQFYSTEVNHSYVKGEGKSIDKTIGYVLSANARNMPYANALKATHQHFNWSFTTLKRHVEAFACGVIEIGLRQGDRLGMIQGNNAENFVAMLGCAKIGATLVQFPEVKNAKDLARFIDLFRPRVLMLPTKLGKTNYLNMLHEVIPEFEKGAFSVPVKSKRFPFLKQILLTDEKISPQEGTVRFKDILVYGPFGYYENPLRRLALNIDQDTPALILLDGTDPNKSTPYVFSHRNLLNAGAAVAEKLGLKVGERVLVPKYLDVPFGSILANFASLYGGSSVVYAKEEYDAASTAQSIANDKIAVAFIRPAELQEILSTKDVSQLDFSSLRAIVTDESASDAIISAVTSTFPKVQIVKVNGFSSVSGLITIDGKLVGNTEVKVTRPEDSKIVHRDTFGDLKIKGDLVVKGQWNDIGIMNPEIDEDGWLSTGKIAKLDKDNKIHFK